jgi:hypothetical protein
MRDRLEVKGAAHDRVSVIPNWVDTTAITPMAAPQRVVACTRLDQGSS